MTETLTPCVRVGMSTPWGRADIAYVLAEGIGQVGTPGHGGIKLDRKRNAQVPEYMRLEGGWYEEDCDWSIPFVVFTADIVKGGEKWACAAIEKAQHIDTFRNWHPDAYEKFFGCELQPGESSVRDERVWKEQHKNDLQVVAAYGSWKVGVPMGMVYVEACVGGCGEHYDYREKHHRYFLVPKEEYDQRGKYSFIVDPTRHPEYEQPLPD